jgi:hypothetical protein
LYYNLDLVVNTETDSGLLAFLIILLFACH